MNTNMNIEIKEKTNWYYIGEEFENSFEFIVSKIHDNDLIIITDKDTPQMNVYKIKKEEFIKNYNKNRIIKRN